MMTAPKETTSATSANFFDRTAQRLSISNFAHRVRENASGYAISVATVISIIALWYGVTNFGLLSENQLPTPQTLVGTFWMLVADGYQGESLYTHIEASLFRALSGFVIGSLIGIPVGLMVGYSRLMWWMLAPIVGFLRPIPPIAFIPLVILYFGLGETGKVVLIIFTAFNYVLVNSEAGAVSTPGNLFRAAQMLGLSQWQTFRKVIVPAAMPQIFTGLKVALALSWAVVVAAELVGAQKGLGFMVSNAAQLLQIPVVFIGITIIGFIGLVLTSVLTMAERRIVHWSTK
ncbi:ABC transporter permease [soil metagenome]